ncbi:hypothetical protein WJX81_004273 [Elliptochloris bilobata]|uniref:DNA polymerase kappa n=1 Tax=Elliptochloris bilobata TaxID=381761 RepID=A0AAW1RKR6_9CHLO
MQSVDAAKVKQVVFELSKDSAHFKNEERKQVQTAARIKKLQEQRAKLTAAELALHTRAMDAKVAALRASADLTRTWLCVDMDAFFAACEELDNPTLKSKPMAVGGIGMCCTANYEARKYGVRSAMPGFIARKLCPELVFVKPCFEKYSRVSAATREVFACYDPDFEACSLDEACLDVTDYCTEHGVTGGQVAEELRARVRERTRVTCSCGVAPNRLLAKIASDMNKPDGQIVLPGDADAVAAFMARLPIRKVPGIGKVTEQTLRALGAGTCSDLLALRGVLAALCSTISSDFFIAAALGVGRTCHSEMVREGEVGRKGISMERTFRPVSDRAELEAKCGELAEALAEDMARESLRGRTITLKLKTSNFEVRTRAVTLGHYISAGADICAEALRLLRMELPLELRLMGIRMSSFFQVTSPPPGQKTLSGFLQGSGNGGSRSPPGC